MPTGNTPEAPELGTPHYKGQMLVPNVGSQCWFPMLVPNGVHYIPLYSSSIAVITMFELHDVCNTVTYALTIAQSSTTIDGLAIRTEEKQSSKLREFTEITVAPKQAMDIG